MAGLHQGEDITTPAQNTDDAPYGGQWEFFPATTAAPWKSGAVQAMPTGSP